MNNRWLGVALICGWVAIFGLPFSRLLAFSYQGGVYTHIMLVPIVSGYLFWVNRKEFSFDEVMVWPPLSLLLLTVGLMGVLAWLSVRAVVSKEDGFFLIALPGVVVFWAIFLGYFGIKTFKSLLFPLLFLAFMVPLPSAALDALIKFLQMASVSAANAVFSLLNIPFLREGTIFRLPGMSVNVAPECSGIRSFFALTVLSFVAAYLFLNSNWRRAVLLSAVLPVAIFKNGLRVVLLAYLGAYVDPGFVTDSILHREGGRPFLFIATLILIPLLWGLRRNEKRSTRGKGQDGTDCPAMGAVSLKPVSK